MFGFVTSRYCTEERKVLLLPLFFSVLHLSFAFLNLRSLVLLCLSVGAIAFLLQPVLQDWRPTLARESFLLLRKETTTCN